MKMYVPEIGDSIVLTKDWSFNFYPERRNTDLGKYFGYYIVDYKWVDEKILPCIESNDNKYDDEDEVSEKYWNDWQKWFSEARSIGKDIIQVKLPIGSILSVDRIYIRKGAKDFSSISFYVKNLGTIQSKVGWGENSKIKNKKALRFWAKLQDCNNIEFEFIK
ncbi:hypothetical protein M0Q50_08580 [bacterium]|jgi:hypothetical protein|nr:hypothetical protein [bacterium]